MKPLAAEFFISAIPDCFFRDVTITARDFDITTNNWNDRSSPFNMTGYYPVQSSENINSAKKCQEIRESAMWFFMLCFDTKVGLTS